MVERVEGGELKDAVENEEIEIEEVRSMMRLRRG